MKKATQVCCFLVSIMAMVAAFVPAHINGNAILAAVLGFGLLANAIKD